MDIYRRIALMPLVKVVKNKTRCFRHDIKAQQGVGGTWILEKEYIQYLLSSIICTDISRCNI